MNKLFERSQVIELLTNNVVEVTFTKKNGEERTMKCTLKQDLIETFSNTSPTSNSNRKNNFDVVPVYDLDKNEWRSFRVDSIKTIAYKG